MSDCMDVSPKRSFYKCGDKELTIEKASENTVSAVKAEAVKEVCDDKSGYVKSYYQLITTCNDGSDMFQCCATLVVRPQDIVCDPNKKRDR